MQPILFVWPRAGKRGANARALQDAHGVTITVDRINGWMKVRGVEEGVIEACKLLVRCAHSQSAQLVS